jgi:misacylated tRNA(Ala) deacylase
VPDPTELLYANDAYLRDWEATVVAVDSERGAVALDATVFFAGGGGQPPDEGVLAGRRVTALSKDRDGVVWHELADGEGDALPAAGDRVGGAIDWQRRHLLMRTHTALHVMNGIIWNDHRAHVTGAHMTPGEGRLDFELDSMSREFGQAVEDRVNEEIQRALPVRVLFLPRSDADRDPTLMRLKANLIPASVDPLRVIEIVGLDRQADGGTHVESTAEIGRVRVVETKSKGRLNKRIRIALDDAS